MRLSDIFHLRCDEAADLNSLESLFPTAVRSYPVQTFCPVRRILAGSISDPLDAIHPALCPGRAGGSFETIRGRYLEKYRPELRLVITSG